MDMDVDIVPMGEFALDDGARDGIVGQQILDRLVGEDDAPAERVVGAVALDRGRSRARDRAASSRSRNKARPARRRGTRCASSLSNCFRPKLSQLFRKVKPDS